MSSKASLVWFLGILLIFVDLLVTKQGQNLLLMLWQPPNASSTPVVATDPLSQASTAFNQFFKPASASAQAQNLKQGRLAVHH